MLDLRSCSVTSLAIIAFFAGLPLVCRADTVSFSTSVPFTTSSFSNVSLSSINQFDPAMGTLTGVVITVNSHGNIDGTVKNTSISFPATFSVALDSELLLDSTLGPIDSLLAGHDYGDLTAGQNYSGLAGGATANLGPINGLFSHVASPSFISGLAPFLGTGSLGLELGSISTTTVTGGGSAVTTNLVFQSSATVDVTYTFAAATTPEPASLWFALLGGVAMFIGNGWRSLRNVRP